MSFGELAAPAIKTAREGFPIHEVIMQNFDMAIIERAGMAVILPYNAEVYLGGQWWRPLYLHDRLAQPDLADTFEAMVNAETEVLNAGGSQIDGYQAVRDYFYKGPIAETIAGVNNPAGRLPVPFYRGVEQLPEFTDYSMKGRTYRYFEGEPLYPFGHGLSYSSFAYAGLKLSKAALDAGEPLQVQATVTNTSAREGDEVVQVYVGFPKVAGAPKHALRGFTRVHLKAGEAQTVQFTLSDRDLSYVDEAGNRLVGAGAYTLTVGGGQHGTKAAAASAPFEIKGAKGLPR